MTLSEAERNASADARESLIRTSLDLYRLPGIGLDVETNNGALAAKFNRQG